MTQAHWNLEGRLTIRITPERAEISSSRPLSLTRGLAGRPVAEAVALVPRIYALCGTAQAAAAAAAAEDAAGVAIDAPQGSARQCLVEAENLREHLLRVITSWAEWLGERPDPRALAPAMQLPERVVRTISPVGKLFAPGGTELRPDTRGLVPVLDQIEGLLEHRVLGRPPREWLALEQPEEAMRPRGEALGPRYLRALVERGWAEVGAVAARPLPELDPGRLEQRLGGSEADIFVSTPDWDGEVHETGAYARRRTHPLVQAARAAYGAGLLARALARLVELAGAPRRLRELAGELTSGLPQTIPPADGAGIGQVEAARGRLVHRLVTEDGRITDYRILAPTEWNFHPRGVVMQALERICREVDTGRPVPDKGAWQLAVRQRGGLLIEAIDPCIGYEFEVAPAPGR